MGTVNSRRLNPVLESPDTPIDKSLLWIDSSNPDKPVAKIPHNEGWASIVGEKGENGEKGEKGDEPQITADDDGTIYSDGKVLTTVVKDASEEAIRAAEQADEAREEIQEDLDTKLDKDTIVLISDVEYQILVDTGHVDPTKIYYVYKSEDQS